MRKDDFILSCVDKGRERVENSRQTGHKRLLLGIMARVTVGGSAECIMLVGEWGIL